MCGIVGYIGKRNASPIILNGLQHLEYRGYDSAGLAVLEENGSIKVHREVGKLINLRNKVDQHPIEGHTGIGHTRWATHGEPSERNSHPHASMDGSTVVVHNGIIENFVELREELQAEGVEFSSDTDTEVVVHLVERYMAAGKDLATATKMATQQLLGASAVVVMSANEPGTLDAGVRLEGPGQETTDHRRVVHYHDAVGISGIAAGAARGGLFFWHQIRPTWTNLDSMMSLSKGFMMYSFAPASMAVLMCSMSFSVVQKTTTG